ncbi:hypothetical protein ABZX77_52280 [Streptomyces sp. NPDC004237]|uniref:hypothetical protein n=1 Tax=Streptomyces sp. NPDC004237 TaxID=3154455 RepID=UPI0033B24ECE
MRRSGGTRRAAVLLCAAAVLLLGACGTRVAGQGDGGSPSSAAAEPIPWATMQPSAVNGVRVSGDRRTLLLDTQVPGGAHACVRKLRAVLTDSMTDLVWVQITFTSPSMDRASGCTKESTATAKVRLPEPLGDRDVMVDHYTRFTAEGAKPPALRLCGKLGCTPPATGCTPASYDQALMAVGAPEHTYRDSQRCDGKWLVLDFSWRTGPACDDSTDPACSSRLGDRWFFRARESGWAPIVRTSAGGCRDVRRKQPAFPSSLCESLAPLSPSLHPSYPPPSASPTTAGP